MIRRLAIGLLGLAAPYLFAACGDDTSTGPASAPATLVALSPEVDTLVTGELGDPPVSIRVENSIGVPVEGIPVRFFLAAGEGSVFPSVAVSDGDGIAEASFQAPMTPGESTVRVDIPSAVDVTAVEFVIRTEAADSVTLSVVEGTDQRAEIGGQLPIPFAVQATSSSGSPAGGITVAWKLTTGDRTARLGAETTVTGSDGRAQVLLTLGSRLGAYAVEAYAVRGVASDTVRFAAEAVEPSELAIRLDSVSPVPLVSGQPATLFGSGFSSLQAAGTEVRIEGEPAEIIASDEPGRIEIAVPAFQGRCLPARDVGVRILAGEDVSNGEMVRLRPDFEVLDLEIGEVRTLRGMAEVSCMQFDSAGSAREYQIAVQSFGRRDGDGSSLRLVSRSGDDPRGMAAAVRLVEPELDPAAMLAARARLTRELELRENVRRELARRRAVPARAAATDTALVAAAFLPVPGETLRYTFAVRPDLTVSCEDTTRAVEGIIREVRDHLILVEDVNAPGDGFGADGWPTLADALDRVVFPTDTAYFGPAADIDANGRIVLLFTPEVNRLTPAGSTAGLEGFFLPLDLASSGARDGAPRAGAEPCRASNEAEILYLAVPDPDGAFGEPVTRAEALRWAQSVPAHELQHLINAEGRVLGGDGGFEAMEETWLDEGLSHLAEEVVGLRMEGFGPATKLTWSQATATRDALGTFNAFHLDNYFRLGLYMADPSGVLVLTDGDPGGLSGQQMRGFSWFLLRWLADQEGGADEQQLFRALTSGGQSRLRGVANVEQAVGTGWEALLADFAVALPVDESNVPTLPERFRILSWDVRDIYENLNRSAASGNAFPVPYPLSVTRLDFETSTLEFDVRASAVQYFSLASDFASPSLALGLSGTTAREGSALQVTVVRTR